MNPEKAAQKQELVATLIAGNGAGLAAALLNDLARIAGEAGGKSVRTAWLAQDEAADIFCAGIDAETLRRSLKDAADAAAIDAIIQPAGTRRKKLLLADMESTIIEQEMLDELAGMIGLRDKVAKITRCAMNGEIDFAGALRERVALLKGKPAQILGDVARAITHTPGAAALVATMKANGAQTWLVSGGFTCFVRPVAADLGFDRSFANTLVLRDDAITGEVAEPVLDKNGKRALLDLAHKELSLPPDSCLAVGDGANDVPMLEACNEAGGMGIAYQAKPKVRAAVPNQINYGDLTALLYAQGYRKEDFISSSRT